MEKQCYHSSSIDAFRIFNIGVYAAWTRHEENRWLRCVGYS